MKASTKRWIHAVGLVALSATALAGLISAQDKPIPETGVQISFPEQLPAAQPPQSLRFSVLNTASSKGSFEALIVGGGSWFKYRRPIQMAVLVQHPKAIFLFDTGLGRHVDEQFLANGWFHRQIFAYKDVKPAADTLLNNGWSLADIKIIIPSHMHWDHVSGLADFPDATVLIQPTELSHARAGGPPAFIRSQFEGVKHWQDLAFATHPYMGFEKSLDLFGDGSVVLVPLGGHTAGQVGMFLNLPSGQRYFFTGDTTWTLDGFKNLQDRSWALNQVVHLDHDQQDNHRSIIHVHQLMKRFPDVKVIPAHDEFVAQTLPQFPQFQH